MPQQRRRNLLVVESLLSPAMDERPGKGVGARVVTENNDCARNRPADAKTESESPDRPDTAGKHFMPGTDSGEQTLTAIPSEVSPKEDRVPFTGHVQAQARKRSGRDVSLGSAECASLRAFSTTTSGSIATTIPRSCCSPPTLRGERSTESTSFVGVPTTDSPNSPSAIRPLQGLQTGHRRSESSWRPTG